MKRRCLRPRRHFGARIIVCRPTGTCVPSSIPHINLTVEEFRTLARMQASLSHYDMREDISQSCSSPSPHFLHQSASLSPPSPVVPQSNLVPEVLPVLPRRPERDRADDRAHRLHEDVLKETEGVTVFGKRNERLKWSARVPPKDTKPLKHAKYLWLRLRADGGHSKALSLLSCIIITLRTLSPR